MSDGNIGYIVAAYGLVWATLAVYVVRLWQRLAAVGRDPRAGVEDAHAR